MPDDPLAPQNPPSQYTAPLTPAPVAGATSTGMAPNVAAGVAVIFTFISGIIFLVIEKRSQFVRFWAMQSTIYGLIWLVVRIAVGVLLYATITSYSLFNLIASVSLLVNLAFLIGWVIMLYYAFTGKEWEMPVLGKFARQQLLKFPPKP